MSKKVRIGISAVLLGWLAWKIDWEQVVQAFSQLRLEFWFSAVALLVIAQVVSTFRWQQLAQALGFRRPIHHMIGFYFIGMYFNLLLPTSVGGDVVRVYYLDNKSNNRMRAFLSVFLERLCGFCVLLALACFGILLSPLDLPPWMHWTVGSCAVCCMLGFIALPMMVQHAEKFPGKLRKVLQGFRELPSWRTLVGPLLFSIFVQVTNVIICWLVAVAIGGQVPFAFFWIMVPLVSLLTMLPISLNGMGVREGAMVFFLAPLGVGQGLAVTLAFLWFAVSVTVSFFGGFVYLFGHFPRPVMAAETDGEDERDGSLCGHSNQGRTGQLKTAA